MYCNPYNKSKKKKRKERKRLSHDLALVLLGIHTVIFPYGNSRDTQGHDCDSYDAAVLHVLAPCSIDGDAGGSALLESLLHEIPTGVDFLELVLLIGRQELVQGLREDVVVDGPRDGRSNSCTQTGKQANHGQHHGYTLTVCSGHDSHVSANDKRTTGEGDKDLTHHEVPDTHFRFAEVNHQSGTEEDQRQAKAKAGVLELLCDVDDDTKDSRPDARANVVDLANVAGHADWKIIDDHAEVVEIEVPNVVAEEEEASQGTGSDHSTLLEQAVLDEMRTRKEPLPRSKDEEHTEPDNDHDNESRAVVLGSAEGLQAEWEKEEEESDHKEESTDHYDRSAKTEKKKNPDMKKDYSRSNSWM